MDLSGYPRSSVERIEKLFDILERIGNIGFLSERLSLYGGTALNFIHFREVPRLSVDLDLNYRHTDPERDWGDVRKDIDAFLFRVLYDLGYADRDIKVQARYPLGRMDLRYISSQGTPANIKIETGYMRRIPITREDERYEMENPRSGSKFLINSPCKEELFANKFCTMISRMKGTVNARDAFDVHTISRASFEKELFLDIVMVEGLMMDLDLTDPEIVTDRIPSTNLRGLILGEIDTGPIEADVNSFYETVQSGIEERGWSEFRDHFIRNGVIDPTFFRCNEKLNDRLGEHPQLRWMMHKRDPK